MNAPSTPIQPPAADVTVLYADDALLVLDKPAGLLSVPGRGPENADCLSSRVQRLYPEARIVHRLDMGTSGLLVMARGAEMQAALNQRFAQRTVHKTYEALVAGIPATSPSKKWASIRLPLRVDWPNRPRSHVTFQGGKPSHTLWTTIEVLDRGAANAPTVCSRLRLRPITGRSHQLRVHLMAIGHPILGDELYAPHTIAQASPRLMLHACQLAFAHPVNGKAMDFHLPAPF